MPPAREPLTSYVEEAPFPKTGLLSSYLEEPGPVACGRSNGVVSLSKGTQPALPSWGCMSWPTKEEPTCDCFLTCKTRSVSSVAQSCPTLCDPMDCSVPVPVHHQLPELARIHVHQVSDAIQPSHPLSSPSPPTFNLPSIRVFSNEWALRIRWPRYWSLSFSISPSSEHPGLISFGMDWLDLLAVQGTPK